MVATNDINTIDWSKISVLVVDDETFAVDLVKTALRKLNIQKVNIAHDGQTALEMANNQPLGLVISDWNMPEKDGLEFLRELRQIQESVPFFMLTGNVTQEHVKQAINAGVDGYIAKPFKPKDLQKKIHTVLKKRYG